MLKLDTTTVSLAVSALQSTVWQVQTLNRCAERECEQEAAAAGRHRGGQGEMLQLVMNSWTGGAPITLHVLYLWSSGLLPSQPSGQPSSHLLSPSQSTAPGLLLGSHLSSQSSSQPSR